MQHSGTLHNMKTIHKDAIRIRYVHRCTFRESKCIHICIPHMFSTYFFKALPITESIQSLLRCNCHCRYRPCCGALCRVGRG